MALPAFLAATSPGDPRKANEDLPGVLGNCAILLDGSGAPGDMPTGCRHGVPWFVRQLGTRCLAGMAADDAEPLPRILSSAIADVSELHASTCDLSCPGTPSCVLVMIRASGAVIDYLVLGDVTLLVDLGDRIETISDNRMGRVAQDEYQAMLSLPIGTPEQLAARQAFVRRQQPLRNHPDGYPVASTSLSAADQALTGVFPITDVDRAALLSDGVTRFAEFGIGTWKDLLDILAADGPSDLFSRIRRAEESDPDGQRWPRAKLHDDVGAVLYEMR